jgi:PilZ domain-containing protein
MLAAFSFFAREYKGEKRKVAIMPATIHRRFRRFSVNVPCLVKPRRVHKAIKVGVIPAETKDISRGGLCFVASADWKVGTEIECAIELPLQPSPHEPVKIRCRGTIVRIIERQPGRFEVGASIDHFSYPHPNERLGQTEFLQDIGP